MDMEDHIRLEDSFNQAGEIILGGRTYASPLSYSHCFKILHELSSIIWL